MPVTLSQRGRSRMQQHVRRLARSALRDRIEALRLRLARPGLGIRSVHQRVTGRVSALDRVMRRLATHSHRAFTAHRHVQVLLAGAMMRNTQRIEVRERRGVPAPVRTLRQEVRTLAVERVLQQRLLQRLTRTPAAAASPRLSFITRVESRHAAPRIQLTLVRTQPAVAQTASAARTEVATPSAQKHSGPAQLRSAPATPPLVLPPQELSRLTDHVIRQLDHRVLSWQERTGRV